MIWLTKPEADNAAFPIIQLIISVSAIPSRVSKLISIIAGKDKDKMEGEDIFLVVIDQAPDDISLAHFMDQNNWSR